MKKRRLNIIDVIVILSILAIVFVVGYKYVVIDKQSGLGVTQAYKDIEYELMVNNVRIMTAEAFNVGDKIYEEKKGTYMGTIKDVKVIPYVSNEMKSNGELVEAEKVGYYTVFLTVESSVVDKEAGYYLSGTLDLKVNSEYEILTKFVKTTSKATNIKLD